MPFVISHLPFAIHNLSFVICNSSFNENSRFAGIFVGLVAFLIIGIFHPIVIKCEYYFGIRCWWWFLLLGLGFIVLSVWLDSVVWQSISGVTAFSCFWSIKEIFEQRERVRKGWFPRNPRRK